MMTPQENGSVSDKSMKKRIRVGLIGNGIQLSRTPKMHMQEGEAQGVDYIYDMIDPEVMGGPEPKLSDMLNRAEEQGFAGLNITFPYKQEVIEHLDELNEHAALVGAVNTVVFRDGRRIGHNTDFWGFAQAVREGLGDASLDTVLQLGAGGAGRAVAFALKWVGVENLLIADVNPEAAKALAKDVGGTAITDLSMGAAKADGIVNATPMGMAKLPGTAIDVALLTPRHWVADIVYFPMETELLAAARAKGCRTLDGSGMAVFQAVRAFSLFSGLDADADRMKQTFQSFDASHI
jgi:shikimate dehydrogenase